MGRTAHFPFKYLRSIGVKEFYLLIFTFSFLIFHFSLFTLHLERDWGWVSSFLRIYWTAPLNSTSCRGLVIDLPSARRCDGEGSPCQRWGLAISVKSKENASKSEGEHLHNWRKDWLRRALSLQQIKEPLSNSSHFNALIKLKTCVWQGCFSYLCCMKEGNDRQWGNPSSSKSNRDYL